MIEKKWTIKEAPDEQTVLALADSLNISNILATILIHRGITNFNEAKIYFRPDMDSLHDPFLMDGMQEATNRIIDAITSNEKIVVYGDYDVDGTSSAALLYLFLKELNANVEVHIPNRLTDGYGLSNESINLLAKKKTNLIITVDCGITAVDEVAHATSLGIDTIISDHHKPKETIPNAVAVLDPLKPGCNYPYKYLSGAGVAFKLARAVSDRVGRKDGILQYLDLVALAAAADIVPLTDENRILVRRGMEMINSNPRPGILALIKKAKKEVGSLTAGQVVFTIAPRINAVGRMGDAKRAVDLFIEKDIDEADRMAQILEDENYQRRKIDEMTFSHAVSIIEEKVDLEKEVAIIIHVDEWHPGVIGIVASRVVEKYYRPAIMLSTVDGVAKGSARSITGFNIYEALQECNDMLIQFGGHEAAAGVAIEIANIDKFRIKFNHVLREKMKEKDIVPEIKADINISLSDITPKFVRILDQFAPFGPGNMRPVFVAKNVQLANYPRIVGNNHLLTTIKQNGGDKVFDAIGFNLGYFAEIIAKDRDLIDIVFTIEKISRNGVSYPQIRLKDIKVKENVN
ncbi:MAG: single-stranded-DNA-specific exonuclease RecJ [Bacteroidetes bacterium]|nr:single-stranded-DNA-specific exonuclease RecJ [Bacteroidota bacterium]MBU1116577.1 single-stranded-DNA-specific exonuclease RecJ [Bacteroidota bacterium]MBU1797201.1 single-stranded-DNA-specific exonuclease RecJ [Bacteroidota bacterium]